MLLDLLSKILPVRIMSSQPDSAFASLEFLSIPEVMLATLVKIWRGGRVVKVPNVYKREKKSRSLVNFGSPAQS